MMKPRRHRVDNRGLGINVVEWGAGETTLVLCHGFVDHARSWDWVAELLVDAGYRVLAIDFRGHGHSDWASNGGYYFFQHYVLDLDRVIDALVPGRLCLVGHSMGGMVTSYYTGTFPDRVSAWVNIEGFGPPDNEPSLAPIRMRDWIAGVKQVESRPHRVMADVAEAAARIKHRNPRFSEAMALHQAEHGTRPVDGGVSFTFDPLHMTWGPQPFYLTQARAFWQRVSCPTLLVSGSESPLGGPHFVDRVCVEQAERVVISEAGHMVHLEQPKALAEAILAFLRAIT
jgi:pimeloyl-ACP methyl ester carboxylesterase